MLKQGIWVLICVVSLAASCSSDDDSDADAGHDNGPLASADGTLLATVRRTTAGVAHIQADDLSSAAFASGYVQAEDNLCLIAESIVKARGERARFFGSGLNNENIISDFSYRALAADDKRAEALSASSQALLNGFAAGYNLYLQESTADNWPPACRNQPWVRPISADDLLAHYMTLARVASGDIFATGALFAAVPPDTSAEPTVVAGLLDTSTLVADARAQADSSRLAALDTLASNAWAIGENLSETGRGALLANPHFPYTGPRRFYQLHVTVPGYYNVNGAAPVGVPIPLMGFNQNLGWSHTFSTSHRFTLYELTLAGDDNSAYVKDGATVPITSRTLQIEVANGTDTPTVLEREIYYSEYGPMLAADLLTGGALPSWGENASAYTYRDANNQADDLLDTWLGMGRATTLAEFQRVFENCGSTLWNNTVMADDQGNAYYVDSSSVPHLSAEAIAVLNAKLASSSDFAALHYNGLSLLEGNSSRDDWIEGNCDGIVPYVSKPKLVRDDFVQNSNSSHWLTNPAAPLTGFSPLYGDEQFLINARTQLGLRMLQSPTESGNAASAPGGQDGLFNADELLQVIWNNRGLYAESVLAEVLDRCSAIGDTPVIGANGNARSVAAGCEVLASWDGLYNLDSVGAHVFRVLTEQYFANGAPGVLINFDPNVPAANPYRFSNDGVGTADDPLMQALATGLDALDAAAIAYDATLGSVQRYTPSGGVPPLVLGSGDSPTALASPIPWHGGNGEIDGAFNAVGPVVSAYEEDTRLPRISNPVLPYTGLLSSVAGEGWAIARGTSWHFGLAFTDEGPEAYGLLSYSQSSNPDSDHFIDQALDYSNKTARRLLYSEEDIAANLLPDGEYRLSGQLNVVQ